MKKEIEWDVQHSTFHVKKGKKSTDTNNSIDCTCIHIYLNKCMEDGLGEHIK